VKIVFSIIVALALALILGLAMAAPAAAVQPPITVEIANPIAWELSDYTIKFENAGLLLGPADYIDIMFPTGTDVTTVTGVTVSKGPASTGPFAGIVTTYHTIGANSVRIYLDAAEFIERSDWVLIVLDDVTNPGPGDYVLWVGTSTVPPVASDVNGPDPVAVYEVTMAVDPAGSGTAADVTDESPYQAGITVSIKAEANAGYQFVNWTAAPAVLFGDANATEATFIMPNQAVTVTANFELIPTYTLTMAAAPLLGGAATDETGTTPYEAGATVAIKAVAASGYRFVNWTATPDAVFSNADAAETTFTMPGEAVTVTANFAAVYELTISSTTGGSVTSPGEGIFTYDAGKSVSLVAEPDDGYVLVKWTGDVDAIADPDAASTTITMDDNYSITATFSRVAGCFIATAAYGTPMAKEIQVLRDFRDEYLLTNPAGQALVDLYYRVSPPMAEFITEHPSLKPIVRTGLLPAVALSTIAVKTSLAEKAAAIGLLVLISVALAVWAIRRRRNLCS
jgi:hypothetical protein